MQFFSYIRMFAFGNLLQAEEPVLLDGVQLITEERNQQCNAKQSFRFGETKIVIERTINQSRKISCALDTVRVESMLAKATAVRIKRF